MILHPAYAQVVVVLIATVIMMMGHGLLLTLVPLSATVMGFSQIAVGAMGSAYFGGMLAGCIVCPRVIARIGHIRAFMTFATFATVLILALPVFVDPIAWILSRMVTGFCMAGLYSATESWMHEKAENVVRGQLLASYQLMIYIGLICGQQALRLASPTTFVLFSLAAAAMMLSTLPLAFTRTDPPISPLVPRMQLSWLYSVSPVAVVAMLATGAANGTFWTMLPVFAKAQGFNNADVATMITAVVLGAALIQWPVGHISDRIDRRQVLLFGSLIGAAIQLIIANISFENWPLVVGLMFLMGCTMMFANSVASSHAGDRAGRGRMVEVSSGLLLVYTISASVGPLLAAVLMQWASVRILFFYNCAIQGTLAAFVFWRMMSRPGP